MTWGSRCGRCGREDCRWERNGTCEPDDVPSDGALYAAHSRSLCTPEQNAAIDAELEQIVNQIKNDPAWRSQIAYRDSHVDVLPRPRRVTVAELTAFVLGSLAAVLVFSVVVGKLLGVI